MLGFIDGKLIAKSQESPTCVVQTFRLGFEVLVPKSLFDSLLVGQKVKLWLHTHVREDILMLYGFSSEDEKNLFRVLLGVSGLGPKTAMSLISEHGAHRLVDLILHKATSDIAKAPGVGKKLAEKLPLELESKLEKWVWRERLEISRSAPQREPLPKDAQLREDLMSALSNLGYVPNHIKGVLERLWDRDEFQNHDFELCLKAALRDISNRGITAERHG